MLLEDTSNGNVTLLLPDIYYIGSILQIKKLQENEKFDSPFHATCKIVEYACT